MPSQCCAVLCCAMHCRAVPSCAVMCRVPCGALPCCAFLFIHKKVSTYMHVASGLFSWCMELIGICKSTVTTFCYGHTRCQFANKSRRRSFQRNRCEIVRCTKISPENARTQGAVMPQPAVTDVFPASKYTVTENIIESKAFIHHGRPGPLNVQHKKKVELKLRAK